MGKVSSRQLVPFAACVLFTIMVTACGGGGGGGGGFFPLTLATQPAPGPAVEPLPPRDPAPPSPADPAAPIPSPTTEPEQEPEPDAAPEPEPPQFVASATVAAKCERPRDNVIDPASDRPYPDKQGELIDEKNWVRSWINETYLWFDEVKTYSAIASYQTPVAYFDVLKTQNTTSAGRPKDRFHFTAPTDAVNANSEGREIGYGMTLAFVSVAPPRDVRVAYVEPGSPAANAGVARGDRLIVVDDASIDTQSDQGIAAINAAIAPQTLGESHTFKLRAVDNSERSLTLTSAAITRDPVPLDNVLLITMESGKKVGYLVFNEHIGSAELALAKAMGALKFHSITDLVIDMRYNGGGLLAIASQLAYMVGSNAMIDAAPLNLSGKTFEELRTNSKNPFNWGPNDAKFPFIPVTLGYSAAENQALPQLGLSRVTVLAGPDTCSASEAVINSLRGVGVAVNIVGGTTCGKPYSFFPKDNCSTTYFAIQAKGVNDKGFGDYEDGFAPTCAVVDDFSRALGDPEEARLAAALQMIEGKACPTQTLAQKGDVLIRSKAEEARVPYLKRSPMREIKWSDGRKR